MTVIPVKNFEQVIKSLEYLEAKNTEIQIRGNWNLQQHLMHCGLAIQYSMIGYPIEKPKIFQNTIGKLAFHYFLWKGHMSHDTNMLTPGAPLMDHVSLQESMDCLKSNILQFMDWKQPLKSHEFYGKLSKKHMETAHCMHINDHLDEMSLL